MKIKVGLSKTINIGNFENVKPSVEIEDDLQEIEILHPKEKYFEQKLETAEECYERLAKLCHRLLVKEIKKFEDSNSK